MDKKSPINTVSEHTKIYDSAFQYRCRIDEIAPAKQELKKQMGIDND